jgi:hypothetical protein
LGTGVKDGGGNERVNGVDIVFWGKERRLVIVILFCFAIHFLE